ncbi:MAG TPA: HEAT repeat domain-containing protein [Spirochaetia bacterium]|nr:HEAT repeat domain-containing protein [Spirochaetia bacterium]
MKISKQYKQQVLFFGAIGISIFLLFFVICCTWIGFDVKNQCNGARRDYGGDCTEALVKLLKDENKGFRLRNSAVWALGQLGDSRALPVLQSFYTGNIPSREPLDESISQYELEKAIKLTSGGANITAIFWRYGVGN